MTTDPYVRLFNVRDGRHRRDLHPRSSQSRHPGVEETEHDAGRNRVREARADSVAPDDGDEPAAEWVAEG